MRHNNKLKGLCYAGCAHPQKPSTQALGITKYSIVTNSNDSVTLRPSATEHDLAMLYEWLNRSHIVEWWGGEEARPTLADVQEQYLPSVTESVTIAMLNGEHWVCPVVRCS